ncbi:phosphotransferase family protein [Marmoricola sp. RAF53]|uniref:phosphotransferase family protein n=1 Tax=Marmoricola sp. RAF53 TaxID=3233059 RepID=UPI003F9496F0
MWQPDPSWVPLRAGGGPATVGLWRTRVQDQDVVVKRLRRPEPDEAAVLGAPDHAGYWRREVEVALDLEAVDGPGLVPAPVLRVEEDDEGATVVTAEVVAEPPPALFVAAGLGRFAGAPFREVGWASRRTLTDRLAMAEARGGWPTLRRTTLADAAEHLWARRTHWLAERAAGPAGRLHGDAVPANFLASRGQDVLTVDWQGFGIGPIGTDLGYYALSAREDFDVLLDAYCGGLTAVGSEADRRQVRIAASVMAVYTVFSRAEWALARIAPGEGALAGKYGHPSVAPHLRALQRQIPRIEALLGSG